MTNFDRLRSLSVEEMAKVSVKPVYDEGGWPVWITSDSSEFGWDNFEDALAHEIDWLNAEAKED